MNTVQHTVMIVDDIDANLRLLSMMLGRSGYRTVAFTLGREALAAAAEHPPDIVLLDINMPEMDGFEVCRRLKEDDRLSEIPVLFISALHQTEDKVRAFSVGGVDYIPKPFNHEEVTARVKAHLTITSLRTDLRRHNERLEQMVQEKVVAAYESQLATITALAKLAEHRDDDTGRHLDRVQRYVRLLAEHLAGTDKYEQQIDIRFINNLYHASPLHDIGKVAISDSILLKPGKLTAEEYGRMKTHTTIGARTLESVRSRYTNNKFLAMGEHITRSHHERWDGGGYPDGLAGERIPLEGRIMAIADVYDALRSRRVYKPAFTHEKARDIILEGAGTQFDPDIAAVFAMIEPEFEQVSSALQSDATSGSTGGGTVVG